MKAECQAVQLCVMTRQMSLQGIKKIKEGCPIWKMQLAFIPSLRHGGRKLRLEKTDSSKGK